MAIDEESGAGQKTGVHAHPFASIRFDNHETFPLIAIAFGFSLQFLQEIFLEFQDFFDIHAGNERMGGGDVAVGEEDVLELVVAGRQN